MLSKDFHKRFMEEVSSKRKTNNSLHNKNLILFRTVRIIFCSLGSFSLEKLENKLIDSQYIVSRTRKSLVKGERFIRFV